MEYYLEFDITEEAVDYKGRTSALMSIKADPTSTKSKAKVEDELLALYGLNPRQYDKTPEEIQQSQQAIAPQAIAQQAIAQQAIAPQSQEVINQQ
jgi:alpha-glucuronidase